jgi:hypothetical protein
VEAKYNKSLKRKEEEKKETSDHFFAYLKRHVTKPLIVRKKRKELTKW